MQAKIRTSPTLRLRRWDASSNPPAGAAGIRRTLSRGAVRRHQPVSYERKEEDSMAIMVKVQLKRGRRYARTSNQPIGKEANAMQNGRDGILRWPSSSGWCS